MRGPFGLTLRFIAMLVAVAGCATMATETPDYANVPKWTSRAIPEARGEFKALPNGTREAVRYSGWTKADFASFRTYAYDDRRPEPPVQRVEMPKGLKGDPKEGRKLFMARSLGPCTGCHLIPGDD